MSSLLRFVVRIRVCLRLDAGNDDVEVAQFSLERDLQFCRTHPAA